MQKGIPRNYDKRPDYLQEQKQGMIEIFVKLTLPVSAYETAAGLYRIENYRSFDDYVSDCVVKILDMNTEGEVFEDLIKSKIKGENSRWMQNQKQLWGPINKKLKEQVKIEKRMKNEK